MSKTKNCPVCDQPIKLENLEKHIKKVHPRAKVDVEYSEKEEKRLKEHEQRQKELSKPTGLGKYIAIIIIIIVLLAGTAILLSGSTSLRKYENFTVTDTNGNTITLSDWEGEVILLDFMSSTCSWCKQNTQNTLVHLYDKYKNDIKMLSVSIRDEDTNSALIEFKDSTGATWQYALDSGGIQALYGVGGTPTSFLIDRDGNIVYSHEGADDRAVLESKIQSIL